MKAIFEMDIDDYGEMLEEMELTRSFKSLFQFHDWHTEICDFGHFPCLVWAMYGEGGGG